MGGRTLRHSRAQFKFSFFFGPKVLIEIPAHTISFRVLLCFAMASNRILWFAPASITELGNFQVNLTSWPTWQAVSGQHCGLAGCSLPAYPSPRIDALSLCQLNSYQQPFNRAPWAIPQSGRAGVLLAGAGKACFAVDLSFNEIHVDNRAGRRRRHGGGGGRGWACA